MCRHSVLLFSQVDDQRNRTVRSPGHMELLSAARIYVGGLNEFAPELLPLGAHFKKAFQGKKMKHNFNYRNNYL